jgi:hypothetical protein
MKTLLHFGLISALALSSHVRSDDKPAENNETGKGELVDVKYQIHTRYVAGGQVDERKGGWGPSDNFPRAIRADDKFGESEKLSVVVASDEPVRLAKYQGVRLRVVNRSDERAFFSAIDSHLYLVQEALNDKGEWQAIERIPHGTGPRDCAVGFHRISLKPGEYWDLVGPRYTGSFKTKLRYRLDLGTNDGKLPQPGGKIVYSNEYEGSINPEQFQRPGATGIDLRPLKP